QLVIPELEMDEVVTLAKLREDLGLEGDGPKKRGRKPSFDPRVLGRYIKKDGRRPTIERLVRSLASTGERYGYPGVPAIRGLVEYLAEFWTKAGFEWRDNDRDIAVAAAKAALEGGGP